jgi:hypothetical protein
MTGADDGYTASLEAAIAKLLDALRQIRDGEDPNPMWHRQIAAAPSSPMTRWRCSSTSRRPSMSTSTPIARTCGARRTSQSRCRRPSSCKLSAICC